MKFELLNSVPYYIAILLLGLLVIGIGLLAFYTFWPRTKVQLEPRKSWLPKDQYLEIEGFQIRYVQAGKGPHLVLLHGIGASVYIWRFIIKPLSVFFRVTAVDLPGFGESSKIKNVGYGLDDQTRRLQSILSALNINRAHLVGSSMGGALALWYGLKFPAQVLSIIAMAPATHSQSSMFLSPRLKSISKTLTWSLHPTLQNKILRTVLYDHGLITDENKAIYFKPYIKNPDAIYTFFSAVDLLKDPRLPKKLKGLQVPTLIYYGEHDQLVRKKHMVELEKMIPDCQLFLDPEGGHHPMEDNPVVVAEEIHRFLNNHI